MAQINLPWLPSPPNDFRQRCKVAADEAAIQRLAAHALDLTQLTTLAKSLKRLPERSSSPLRLGLLSNGTTSLLAPALIASAARHGLSLEVVEAPYDQAVQTAIDPASVINTADVDLVLLAFDHRVVPRPDDIADVEQAARSIEAVMSSIDTIRTGIRNACGAPLILQTIVPPVGTLLGSLDRRLPGSILGVIDELNAQMIASLEGSTDLLFDACGLSALIGLEAWHDISQWHLAKLSFSQSIVPLYADHIARLLAAARGKSRKCLVLDLDNTLWGGVIGDDGLEGIVLGQGDPAGEAFLDVQRVALHLKQLGVILAVSSKNDDDVARLPFRRHPDMLLKEDDISIFQANWNDKASNLKAISEALDIGIDSLVFLDDNPAERAQVRDALPEVAVPELPEDPAQFPSTLLAAGYFEAISLSEEDQMRANDYANREKRIKLQENTSDLGAFLESLDMQIFFSPFDPTGRSRIAQLINKSNQFNLTTRRYSEAQVQAMEDDPSLCTMQVRLIDRFGDNGMICVVICRREGAVWDIDTWLMSCRVLGRGVEEAVLNEIVRNARIAGAKTLLGRFIPTGRNKLVRDHYTKLGFSAHGETSADHEEETTWSLDLDSFVPKDLPIEVIRQFQGTPA